MGCASSKRIEAAVDIYRPAPASFAVFDINAVQEPWLMTVDNITAQEQQEKPAHVPAPILEKLNKFETEAPHSWDEVSKALEDLKPAIDSNNPVEVAAPSPNPAGQAQPMFSTAAKQKQNPTPRKSLSFHTLEELDEKLSAKPAKDLRKTESMRRDVKKKPESNKPESRADHQAVTRTEGEGFKTLKENIFIVRDRIEREKEGKQANYDKLRRDPLSDFPEKCPPGGFDAVVVYTTSLRGVRRTFEDCSRVRSIFEVSRVVTDERDVSLHGEFLNELRDLLGDDGAATLPKVFVKGRYVGGADELTELNESGKLGRILRAARVETGIGRQACEGCGGARFVPCLDCGGSCKVLVNGEKERCSKCNENGLVHCPACSKF